jgi:hypothetical protein
MDTEPSKKRARWINFYHHVRFSESKRNTTRLLLSFSYAVSQQTKKLWVVETQVHNNSITACMDHDCMTLKTKHMHVTRLKRKISSYPAAQESTIIFI